ncbi:PTS sugar transporter subunit IIA [Orbus wheelerorum]|uniref:PTS sugar transporter subunit IIA n=1 Tax=Orbus wheelerorum TaxID=3074111 RepID=UPI00370D94A3
MISVLLVSHGKMAEGMKDSAIMIVGEQTQFETLSLNPGQDISQLKIQLCDYTKILDSGDGVLIFVDLYGASPYNAAMGCIQDWDQLGMNVRVITGMSLPMVINAVCNRDNSTLYDLANECIETGHENIQDAIDNFFNIANENSNDDY